MKRTLPLFSLAMILALTASLVGIPSTPVYSQSTSAHVPLSLPAGWSRGYLYDVWGSGPHDVYAVGEGFNADSAIVPLLYQRSTTNGTPVIRYVKWDASGANNGTSWADAYTDLQSALAAASSDDEIWVAAGTYTPTTGTDLAVSFTLKNGVAVYGGFAGTETLRTQRDYETNLTVLSGDLDQDDDLSDNSYHVVVGSGTNNSAILDGFTVIGGNANAPTAENRFGGGMYNDQGSPSLSNLIFTSNSAVSGGGISNENDSHPILTNVTFSGNSAREGGGMDNFNGSHPILTNVTFSSNSASSFGGGMSNGYSGPRLTNVTFNNNSAADGGGMYNTHSSPSLAHVTFNGNRATAGGHGAGIYNYSSNPIVRNSILYGDIGGEIYDDLSWSTVTYSIVQGGYPGTGNLDANPFLGTLQDNGGFTRTMALGFRSPAIDAGDDASCPATDQRGMIRPQGAACDIGAYEYDGLVIPTPIYTPSVTPAPVVISGNTVIGGVTLYYSGGMTTSNVNGTYFLTLPYGWSGTVTPYKSGYRFTPERRSYINVSFDQQNQDFGPEQVYTIFGNVGVPSATLSYVDGTLKTAVSGSNGSYSFQVPENWTGTVTPSKTNYGFVPVSRNYSNIQSDQSGQDYAATILYTISGNAGVAGAILSYAEDGESKSVTAGSDGNYSFKVRSGWSGTVTPTKIGVAFTPTNKTYIDVQSNHSGSDYVANITVNSTVDGGSGSLRQAINDAVAGAIIRFDPMLAGQTINLVSTLTFNKDLKIDGSGLNPRVEINGGGAVRIFDFGRSGGNATLQSLILKNGNVTGTTNGGALIVRGGVITIKNVSFGENSAYDGGAIYSSLYGVDLRILQSEFHSNAAQHYGGAVYIQNGKLTLQNTILNNNVAGSIGGAILTYQGGPFLFEDNRFVENGATNNGGAISLMSRQDSVVMRGNLFSGNSATLYYGGALFDSLPYSTVLLAIENNTFHNNSANNAGAVLVSHTVSLKNNTFSNNKATQAPSETTVASVYLSRPLDATIINNVLANNTGGKECILNGSGVTSIYGSNNLVEDGSGPCATLPGAIIADPMLGALADNGGSTQTMALLPGSPAIDVGDSVSCTFIDQRGISRPQGNGCDIGAFEYVPPPTPTPTNSPTPTNTSTPTATPSYSYNPLYLSITDSQTIGDVASADEDILRFDGSVWSLFFDGSDVGVSKTDLFGFSIVDADTILMAFSSAMTINGLAITPQDVVRFEATSLGSTTAGTFSMYLDGSDMGLDTTAEKIDSVSVLSDGRVLISTTGNPSVPGVAGKDEDVLAFTPTSLGDVTSGNWAMYFDGSDVGLAETSGEDVDALDVIGGKVYLSTADNFSVNGLAGADEDVFVCEPTSLGDVTACNYSSSLYFDGSTWGLSANDVDAFNFLVTGPIPTNTPSHTPTSTPSPTSTLTSSPTVTPTRTPTVTLTPPTSMFVQITQPNGGEVLTVGSTYRIRWNSTSDIDKVTIGYKSCDSCLDWIVNNFPNVGYYDWTVNVGNTTNTQFKIDITAYDTGVGSVIDRSDNFFTVLQPTQTPTITHTPTATPTFTSTNTPSVSDLIFKDGFESGDLSAWSSSSTDLGDLSVSSAAVLAGSQGLQGVIDDNNSMYLTDDSPNAELRYRARFYFDPNSITMTSGDVHFIFKGFMGTSTEILRLEFRNSSGAYQLRAALLNDSSAWTNTNWFMISDAPHVIELDWRAATAAGANNGGLTLWIADAQQVDLAGVDNDTWLIDRARLGALAGIDAGTRGTYYFDAFESRRQTYIGPLLGDEIVDPQK